MDKNLDIGWDHGRAIGNDHRHVKCNYCDKEMHGGVTRLKEHLAGLSGDVKPCKKIPKEVKQAMKEHIESKKKAKQQAKLEKQRVQKELMEVPRRTLINEDSDDENEEEMEIRRVMEASRQTFMEDQMYGSSMRFGAGTSSSKGGLPTKFSTRSKSVHIPRDVDFEPRIDSFILKKQGRNQSNIKTAMKGIKDAKKYVGRAISKFLFYNHIPHNVADSPYYHTMVDCIANAGPGVTPPTPWEITNNYLDMEVEEIKSHIETYYKYWDEFGCTLMCDGWSTQNRRKIINFLVYSTYGTVFLKSVDATDEFQNGEYLCGLMNKMVEIIGESRVVQVITDNGSNYKLGGRLLMQIRKQLYWTPCAAHCIDLIFSDMGKEDDVKAIISQCQTLTGFIYNHGWVLSLMRRETKNKELIRPAITRFATHFIALDSIYVHRADLLRMVTSREWTEKFFRLNHKDKKVGDEVRKMILSDKFWNEIASVVLVQEPLVKVLRMVDSDDKADMGYLYEAMDRAKEAIRKNVGKGYKRWWDMIDIRWDKQLHQDIHAAGYFLNPRFQYTSNATNDDEVLSGFRRVASRLEPDISKQLAIDREAELYRMKTGVFNSQKAHVAVKNLSPAEWWSIIAREHAPNLTRLAMRVLSQTVSSSNCERNWTTFSLIHTKIRNRLSMDNLQKLVFVHYNMRLKERHAKRRDEGGHEIDLDSIFHEDDPLVLWTREKEDKLLDERDNSDWLDENIIDDPTIKGKKPEKVYKRKKVLKKKDNSSSSDSDQGAPSGSHDGVRAGGFGGARADDSSGVHAGGTSGARAGGASGSGEYGREHDQFGYDPADNMGYRHADYTGGYYSGGYIPEAHESYTGEYSTGYDNQEIYDSSTVQQDEPSPYDNMMISFMGPDQMQCSYPSYYNAAQGDNDDNEQHLNEPARNSFWW